MEGLDFGSLLNDDEVNALFGDNGTSEDDVQDSNIDSEEEDIKEDKKKTTEVDPENMFEEKPESVGSEDNKDNEEDALSNEDGASPDFFSSIANAFAEEGIFPDLDEDTIKNIKTAKDFRNAIEEQIKAGLDEQQRRVAEALGYGVAPDKIKFFESHLNALNKITVENIEEENERGETLRQNLMRTDYLRRGFSEERAQKAIERAISNGTDIEEAKEALESLKEACNQDYENAVYTAKAESEQIQEASSKHAEQVKKTFLTKNFDIFEDVELSKKVREKALEAMRSPIYKSKDTGEYLTAFQKTYNDNPDEVAAKIGLLYVLTDGFKSLDGIVKKKVKKEVKKGFADLENKINNSRRDSRGNLKFTSGVDDINSIFGKGVKLDV